MSKNIFVSPIVTVQNLSNSQVKSMTTNRSNASFFLFFLILVVIFMVGIEDPKAEAIAELAEFEK